MFLALLHLKSRLTIKKKRSMPQRYSPGKCIKDGNIPAHITIAEFISIEDSLKIRAQLQEILPSGSFLCEKLSFIVPDEDFKFQRKGVFPLGNT